MDAEGVVAKWKDAPCGSDRNIREVATKMED